MTAEFKDQNPDETRQWLEAFDGVIQVDGLDKAKYLLGLLTERMCAKGVAASLTISEAGAEAVTAQAGQVINTQLEQQVTQMTTEEQVEVLKRQLSALSSDIEQSVNAAIKITQTAVAHTSNITEYAAYRTRRELSAGGVANNPEAALRLKTMIMKMDELIRRNYQLQSALKAQPIPVELQAQAKPISA